MSQKILERPLAVVITVMACGVLLTWPGDVAAQDSPEVSLKVEVMGPDKCKITVHPETAYISRGSGAGVKWEAETNPNLGELYWEIRYEENSEGASGNYFGDVNLACGSSSLRKKPVSEPPSEKRNAEWPYMVTVYHCTEDGSRGKKLCDVDPRIKWSSRSVE